MPGTKKEPDVWEEYDVASGAVYWRSTQDQIARNVADRNHIFRKYGIPKTSAMRKVGF